jgi:hypothetical protein
LEPVREYKLEVVPVAACTQNCFAEVVVPVAAYTQNCFVDVVVPVDASADYKLVRQSLHLKVVVNLDIAAEQPVVDEVAVEAAVSVSPEQAQQE